MSAAMGNQAKLGMGAASPVTEMYEFLSENLTMDENFVDTAGILGTRSHVSERIRQGTRKIGGAIRLQPTPVDLDRLLPRILGAAEVSDVFNLAETLPSFYVTIDRVQKVFTYDNVKVNRATFRASQGTPLELTLELVGKDETVANAGTFPALSIDLTSPVYMFYDLSLTVGGTTYQARDIEIVVDNALDTERFLNTQTLTEVTTTDRNIGVTATLPYGDASAAYGLSFAGEAVLATFTNGTVSCAFSMPKCQFPRRSPPVEGRGEIWMTLNGFARKSGSTAELTVTNDSVV